MAFKLFRWEVSNEIARADGNVIYQARDSADSSDVQLYEWSPPAHDLARASRTLVEVMPELAPAEAFSSGFRLYLVASPMDAKRALGVLQSHGVFSGSWPGVIEEPATVVEKPPAPPEPSPARNEAEVTGVSPVQQENPFSTALWIALALLVALCIGLVVRISSLSGQLDSSRSYASRLSSEKYDLERNVENLNSQIKQKDQLIQEFQVKQAGASKALFLAAEDQAKSWVPYASVKLENGCSGRAIYVAAHYLSLQGVWVTRGWWKIDANSSVSPDVYSKDGTFYFYAESGDLAWTGKSSSDSINTDVVQEPFTHRDGDPLEGPEKRSVSMFRRTGSVGGASLEENFTCN